jgi:hypothetical protein
MAVMALGAMGRLPVTINFKKTPMYVLILLFLGKLRVLRPFFFFLFLFFFPFPFFFLTTPSPRSCATDDLVGHRVRAWAGPGPGSAL